MGVVDRHQQGPPREFGYAAEQYELSDVVQQPRYEGRVVAATRAAFGHMRGGYRAQNAVAPERRHRNEFVTDAVEGLDRRESDRQIANLAHAEHGDGAADRGDLPMLPESGTAGDAQQPRGERGIMADLAADVGGRRRRIVDHAGDAQRHLG